MKHSTGIRSRLWSVCTLLLLLILTLGFSTAQAEKGGKGKGAAGGEGYVDTGSAEYFNLPDDFGFLTDGEGTYCHGVDGQVTLKARFIQDLDVYNENERWLGVMPGCCDDGSCGLCGKDHKKVESPYGGYLDNNFWIGFLGTYRKANLNGTPFGEGDRYGERELDFRAMDTSEDNRLWRATMRFDLGRKKPLLLFGHKGFVGSSALCGFPSEQQWAIMHDGYVERWGEQPEWVSDEETASEPVWVYCEADDGDNCVEWTVSTYDLSAWPTSLGDPVRGCLAYSWFKGAPLTVQRNVEANFLIHVKYIPKGETCTQ